MRDDTGVAAECLLAARGYRAADSTDEHARAYVGAILEIESFDEIRALRKMIGAVLKSLAG